MRVFHRPLPAVLLPFCCIVTFAVFANGQQRVMDKRGASLLDSLLNRIGANKFSAGGNVNTTTNASRSNSNTTTTVGPTNFGANETSQQQQRGFLDSVKQKLSEAVKKLIGAAEKLVQEVNEKAKSWEAKLMQRFANLTEKEKEGLMGLDLRLLQSIKAPEDVSLMLFKAVSPTAIPKQFDARQKWPACAPVISAIPDQSSCGSCWAVSTASAYNDRRCIVQVKAGKQPDTRTRVSAADLMACSTQNHGCSGGVPYYAWQFINKTGIVSGSEWVDKQGCKPYPFPPNKFKDNQNEQTTPKCNAQCSNTKHTAAYSKDKKFATNPVMLTGTGLELKMQAELLENGPINVGLEVFEDLMFYSSGVYRHVTGASLGGHAVKIVGWGEDGGQRYWLAANSWNTDWGEKGFFRIRRGVNEGRIESLHIAFGTPKL